MFAVQTFIKEFIFNDEDVMRVRRANNSFEVLIKPRAGEGTYKMGKRVLTIGVMITKKSQNIMGTSHFINIALFPYHFGRLMMHCRELL